MCHGFMTVNLIVQPLGSAEVQPRFQQLMQLRPAIFTCRPHGLAARGDSDRHGLGSHGGDSSNKKDEYSSFLLLVVRPGAPSSVLAPSSMARSP